jgi:hypothetical protein
MADLISKIVRSQGRVDNSDSNSQPTELTSNPRNCRFDSKSGTFSFSNKPTQASHVYASKALSDGYRDERDIGGNNRGEGILKPIATVIETVDSPTRQLNEYRHM